MAKGKHSTALFEVIHSAKRPERIAQSLRTPKWWFKGRQNAEAGATAPEPAYQEPDPAPPGPEASASEPADPPPQPRTFEADRDRGRSSAVHLDFDRNRKEIRLRLRYTTALVSGFGVCVLIGLAYIAGRHLGHGPRVASANESPDIQQLLQQPPRPDVTNIQRNRPSHSQLSGPTDQPRHSLEAPKSTVPAQSRPQVQQPRSLVPLGVEDRLPRTIGLNYVIVQTYPPEEKAAAEQARDYLTRSGIPCTLESAKDFTRNSQWICLMGTAGFAHISAPEYKQYVETIINLGDRFKTSHFNRWNPSPYKYKGPSQE